MTAQANLRPVPCEGDLLFCPGGDEERDMRARLVWGRDHALKRATEEWRSATARELYWRAVDLANAWIMREAAVDHLRTVRHACVRLWMAAVAIEDVEAGDAGVR